MSLDPLPEVKVTKGQTLFRFGFAGVIFLLTFFLIAPLLFYLVTFLVTKLLPTAINLLSLIPSWVTIGIYLLIALDFAIYFYKTHAQDLYYYLNPKR